MKLKEWLFRPVGLTGISITLLILGVMLMATGYYGVLVTVNSVSNPCGSFTLQTKGGENCVAYSAFMDMRDLGYILILAAIVVAVLKGIFNEWRRKR